MDFGKAASQVAEGYEGAMKRKYAKKAEGTQWGIDQKAAKDFSKGATSGQPPIDWSGIASQFGFGKKKL